MARAARCITIDDPNLHGFNAELDFHVPSNCYLNITRRPRIARGRGIVPQHVPRQSAED
jgi:hypothetical protein